jgi:hypothetical protein
MSGANDNLDDEMDEEQILEEAKRMSMAQAQSKPEENYAEFLDNDFVEQIVKDLNLNIDDQDISDLVNENKKKGEEKKKDDDEKDKK